MKHRKEALEKYFFEDFGGVKKVLEIKSLGRGAHGEGYLVKVETASGVDDYVLKSIRGCGLGHDYPSDRAGMLLLALDSYNYLPKHVRAIDVISECPDGSMRPIGGGKEYFLLMERAHGMNYFQDLERMSGKFVLEAEDIRKIRLMVDYLAKIHAVKTVSRNLYVRKLRDIIGHGECLMGVFDIYPRGTLPVGRMAEIEKRCVDWRARLKGKYKRLCQTHGDFHPGNIWFRKRGRGEMDFRLLDRSRGPWGEPADDLTALSINYIFFSVKHYGRVKDAYLEALKMFFSEYVSKTGDEELYSVVAPFFAFRGAVVANPVFYPELEEPRRHVIFNFIRNILETGKFQPEKINDYLVS